jgi:hypothetical protein
MEKTKVFCKDCRYFKQTIFRDSCAAPQVGIEVSYVYGESQRTIDVDSVDYPNRYGDCEYYEPKYKVSLFKKIFNK